jgi:hypothetical protein
MNRIALTLCVLLPLAGIACEKAEPTAEAPPAASTTGPLTDEAVAQAAVPVKEEFEEEAEEAINEDNVESEVDRLEKEIEGDTP